MIGLFADEIFPAYGKSDPSGIHPYGAPVIGDIIRDVLTLPECVVFNNILSIQ
jgi:hypothetical protein